MAYGHQIDLSKFLDRLMQRSDLGEEEQDAILSLPGQFRDVKQNRDFVALRQAVQHASLVVDGVVGRFEETGKGARQVSAVHLPGDMADLYSLVQPLAPSSLQAFSAATIFRIPHSALKEAASRLPALAEAFWRDCVADAAILSQWVLNLGCKDARARIAHLLCEIASRLRVRAGRNSFSFPFAVTQFQIADAVGLTPVHANRVIRGLRLDGVADVGRSAVRVMDWEGMVAAGEFDSGYLQIGAGDDRNARCIAGIKDYRICQAHGASSSQPAIL